MVPICVCNPMRCNCPSFRICLRAALASPSLIGGNDQLASVMPAGSINLHDDEVLGEGLADLLKARDSSWRSKPPAKSARASCLVREPPQCRRTHILGLPVLGHGGGSLEER